MFFLGNLEEMRHGMNDIFLAVGIQQLSVQSAIRKVTVHIYFLKLVIRSGINELKEEKTGVYFKSTLYEQSKQFSTTLDRL